MSKLIEAIWNIILPVQCKFCGVEGQLLCTKCIGKKLQIYTKEGVKFECIDDYDACVIYDNNSREILRDLKYKFYHSLAPLLAEMMAQKLVSLDWSCDLAASVPLHRFKYWLRGFNQAELIAAQLPTPVHTLFARAKYTKAQFELNKQERLANQLGAYKLIAQPSMVRDKNILLVDDVLTSGSTVVELARTLKQHGAAKVYALTWARATLGNDS